jgi:CRISPR/Cas system-associated exonuclease Cas4 (RecB family)
MINSANIFTEEEQREAIMRNTYPQYHQYQGEAFVRASSVLKLDDDSLFRKMHTDPEKMTEKYWGHIRGTAIQGNKVHEQIYNILTNQESDESRLSEMQKKKLGRFKVWKENKNPEILIEPDRTIVSPEMAHAGTPDLVCRIGNKNIVVDFKVGQNIHRSHRMQAEVYARLVEMRRGIKIDKTAIVLFGAKNQVGIKHSEKDRNPELLDDFDRLKDRWYDMFPEPFGEIEQSENSSQWLFDRPNDGDQMPFTNFPVNRIDGLV